VCGPVSISCRLDIDDTEAEADFRAQIAENRKLVRPGDAPSPSRL